MATTRLYAPRPYDEFDSGVAGVAPILSTGTDVDNTKVTAVQAAATASGIGTLPTSAGGTAPAPVAEPLRFRGPWQINTVYSYGDVVSQGGSLYVAPTAFTSGSSFVAGNWTKLAPYDATDPSFSATYAPITGSSEYARQKAIRPVVNVTDVAYGADPTGVADSATAISNAIAALPASGGIVYFPAGTYKIGSTVNIGNGSGAGASTRNGVRLVGEAFGGAYSFGTSSPAVTLLWSGNTTTAILQVNGPLQGWGLENLAIDGGTGGAKYGVRLSSAQYGECANIAIQRCDQCVSSIAVNVFGGVSSTNTMHNKWRNVYVKPNEQAAGGTFGFFLGGSADNSGNSCYDLYENITILFPTTSAGGSGCYGIYFQAADNVRFTNVHYPGGLGNNLGKPIFAGFDYSANATWPADCRIETVDFSSSAATGGAGIPTFLNIGTPSGATPNRIEDISLTNGAPLDPTLDNLVWDPRLNGVFAFPHTPGADLARATDNMALPTANGAVYIRVRDGGRISKVAYRVLTQSGNMSIAVYRNTGYGRAAAPGARLATSGAFAVPVAGYYEQALGATIDLRPGDWIGISADNVTATFNSLLAAGADNSMGNGQQYRQATAHPLPATPSGLVATQGYNIVLAGVT